MRANTAHSAVVRLNYVAQLHEIPPANKEEIRHAIHKLVRAQYGLADPTILARIHTEEKWGGLGIEDPENVADRATLAEYMIALNSQKEAYTAAILQENARHSATLAGTDQAVKRRTKSQMHTASCRAWQDAGGDCYCAANNSRDSMQAQAQRCAQNLHLRICSANDHANTLSERERERERDRHNGKNQLHIGEIIWIKHKETGDERLAAYYGLNMQDIGVDKMALAWLPQLMCQRGGSKNNLLCRKLDAANRGVDITKAYLESNELKRAYTRQTGDKREILTRLSEQCDPTHPPPNLTAIPGIESYWVEEWRHWDIWTVEAPQQELTQRWRSQGRLRKRTINVRILERLREQVDLDPNPANEDKKHLRSIVQSRKAPALEIWTDGTKKQTGQLGAGIRVHNAHTGEHMLDVAWHLTGITGVLGAELAPLAKIVAWAHPALQMKMHTDSQATIDAWRRLCTNGYTERELAKHPERNAINMIAEGLRQKPTLVTTITLHKVTSHIGVPGNEAADLLATLGASGERAAHVSLRESVDYIVLDAQNRTCLGDIRRQAKKRNKLEHRDRWAASTGPQGLSVNALKAAGSAHITGPQRTILSHRKYTREINSLLLNQHKWQYGAGKPPERNKLCKLCEASYSSAAHRIFTCMGPITTMTMAMLKHRWHAHFEGVAELPPWLRRLTNHTGAKLGWSRIGAHLLHTATLQTIAREYAKGYQQAAQEQPQTLGKSLVTFLDTARQQASNRPPALKAIEKGELGQRKRVLVCHPTGILPGWLVTALLQLGINREVHADPLMLQPELDEHGIAEDRSWPWPSNNSLEGGTMRNMLISTTAQVQEWCAEVARNINNLNAKHMVGKHMLLITGADGERHVREYGGMILATWHPNDFLTFTRDWLHTGCEKMLANQESVHLCQWTTAGVEQCWGTPDALWHEIVAGGTAAGSGEPEIERNWGRTSAVKQQILQKKAEGCGPVYGSLARPMHITQEWENLLQQEAAHPELFWASILNLPAASVPDVPQSRLPPETTLVRVQVAGEEVTRRLQLKPEKRPGNEAIRSQLKADNKTRLNAQRNKLSQMEIDIFDARRKIQQQHSYLQRQKAQNAAIAWQQPKSDTNVTSSNKRPREGYAPHTGQSSLQAWPTTEL